MARGDDIEERLVDFAVRIVNFCEHMAPTFAGNHNAKQLLRSGTAPAAHYAEARGAESQNDFVHKLKICLKELNESRIWLKIIIKSELVAPSHLTDLANECDQLCRIVNASVKTSKGNK